MSVEVIAKGITVLALSAATAGAGYAAYNDQDMAHHIEQTPGYTSDSSEGRGVYERYNNANFEAALALFIATGSSLILIYSGALSTRKKEDYSGSSYPDCCHGGFY
jgi:hypothetical protein